MHLLERRLVVVEDGHRFSSFLVEIILIPRMPNIVDASGDQSAHLLGVCKLEDRARLACLEVVEHGLGHVS